MKKTNTNHGWYVKIMVIAVVCCLAYFFGDYERFSLREESGKVSKNKPNTENKIIKPFPWDRVSYEEVENDAQTVQPSVAPNFNTDNDSGNERHTVRELEEVINSHEASEVEAVRAAEALTVFAFDESRLAWITSKLAENMSKNSLNEEQRAQAFENACSTIGHTIDPSVNQRLAISYAAYCVNEKPGSKGLQYNLALITSVAGDNSGAIMILEKIPEKSDEAIFLLAQLHQRNGNLQESAKYSDLLRVKNSSFAEYL